MGSYLRGTTFRDENRNCGVDAERERARDTLAVNGLSMWADETFPPVHGVKHKHWRGFWRHFGLQGAPVLVFGNFMRAGRLLGNVPVNP